MTPSNHDAKYNELECYAIMFVMLCSASHCGRIVLSPASQAGFSPFDHCLIAIINLYPFGTS